LNELAASARSGCALTLQESTPVPHSVVRRLLAPLRTSGLDDNMSLEALADAVGLSPGRLMHVFTESVGIPLRPYLAWLRGQRSACAILGASLTDVAQLAGFADAAHMSRTFRRELGFQPSALRLMRLSEPAHAPRN
jgi:AraC-like DNA-binding protein